MYLIDSLSKLNVSEADYCTLMDKDNCLILYYPKEKRKKDLPTALIEQTLKQQPIDEVHIICFGNRLYGGLLPLLWKSFPDVKTKLMLCSPKANSVSYNTEYFYKATHALDAQLKKVIDHNISNPTNKTDLHITDTPSTLRACILFSKGIPMLCCYQRYVITTERIKGKQHTPCFIAYRNETGNNFILDCLARSIKDEFNAMKKSEKSYRVNEKGELVYG